MSVCFHKSTDVGGEIPSGFLCRGCHDRIAHEDGTKGRSEHRE
jgi:hypothetical protein